MKRHYFLATLLGLSSMACMAETASPSVATPAAPPPAATKAEPLLGNIGIEAFSSEERISYSIGVDLAQHFLAQELEIDQTTFMQGIQDGLKGQSKLSNSEIQNILSNVQQEMLQKKADDWKIMAKKNKDQGDTFLMQNKKKEGVMTRSSGLQYRIITQGTGPIPTASDKVKTHYRGQLIDGTEFDSSYARNMPAVFPVNGVISGWTEALQLMPVGSKWELVVPPELAYGEYGAGAKIGPNATLIFEVELLGIEP